MSKELRAIDDLRRPYLWEPAPASYTFSVKGGVFKFYEIGGRSLNNPVHPYLARAVASHLARGTPLGHHFAAWPSPDDEELVIYQAIKVTFWSPFTNSEVSQLLRARLPDHRSGAWCDAVVYLKDNSTALGFGRIRHMVTFKDNGEALDFTLLEPMPVVTSQDTSTHLMVLEEPQARHACLVPAESLLFGVHLCPVFSSRIRGRDAAVSSFVGDRCIYKRWFVNHYAEEHTGLFFAQADNRALFT